MSWRWRSPAHPSRTPCRGPGARAARKQGRRAPRDSRASTRARPSRTPARRRSTDRWPRRAGAEDGRRECDNDRYGSPESSPALPPASRSPALPRLWRRVARRPPRRRPPRAVSRPLCGRAVRGQPPRYIGVHRPRLRSWRSNARPVQGPAGTLRHVPPAPRRPRATCRLPRAGQAGRTKLSMTFLPPAFSKSISSLLPSTAVIRP